MLARLEKIPLSDAEINHSLTNIPHLIIEWPQLSNYNSLDELLEGQKGVIILLEIDDDASKSGHWICILNKKDIEYFDPYGIGIAEELAITHENNLMDRLIKNTKRKVNFNKIKFQEFKHDVNTCGRWCIVRLRHWPLSLKMFREFIFGNPLRMPPDVYVTYLTMGATSDMFLQ